MGGRLDGEMHLIGRADDPKLEGKAGVVIGASEGPAQGRIDAEMLWKRQGLQFTAVAAATEGGQLAVGGTLPYRFTLAPADTSASVGIERGTVDTLGITIRADSFNLSLFRPLLPPDVATDLAGTLAADGHIAGQTRRTGGNGNVLLLPRRRDAARPGGELPAGRAGRPARWRGAAHRAAAALTGKKQELDAME